MDDQLKRLMGKQGVTDTVLDNAGILTHGHVIALNTVWNLVGLGAPLLVALFAIPLLIRGMGTDRVGVLTLAWAVIGYFSLFDLGLGRALTKLVAERLGTGQTGDLPRLIWTALMIMGIFGTIGALVAAALSPWLVYSVLKIPRALQDETLKSFYLIALSVPVVIVTIGLRAVLEAHQRFDLANKVRIPFGVLTFLCPLFILPFSNSLFPIVGMLVAGSFAACGVFLIVCLHLVPELRHSIRPKRSMIKPLISFGSWMTVTNIVGPLMTYMDRFLIGAFISVTAVAYYATPYEVVTKFWLIPSALVGVLFPAFSTALAHDRQRAGQLFGRGINYTFLALFPLTLLVVALAHEVLTVWLGREFADNSAFVLKWLAAGVFINGIARVPFALVQGAGSPDLTAKMHLIELPGYLSALWWLIGVYGIQGVAIVWVVRVCIDSLILFVMAKRLLPVTSAMVRGSLARIIAASGILAVAGCLTGLLEKGLFLIVVLVCFPVIAWVWLLDEEDRDLLKGFLQPRYGGKDMHEP